MYHLPEVCRVLAEDQVTQKLWVALKDIKRTRVNHTFNVSKLHSNKELDSGGKGEDSLYL